VFGGDCRVFSGGYTVFRGGYTVFRGEYRGVHKGVIGCLEVSIEVSIGGL